MKHEKMTYEEKVAKLEADKEMRAELFKELCTHVRGGYSVDSFGGLCYKTIKEWFSKYPDEFSNSVFELALQEGKAMWEDIGKRQALGSCLGNSRTWYYNMSNRYGWSDKQELKADVKGQLQVNVVNYATPNELTQ
jgi:hypothetical protein